MFAPQDFSQKHVCLRFRNEDVQKHRVFQIFGNRRQEAQASKKAGRGNRAWDPCFVTPASRRLRLVGDAGDVVHYAHPKKTLVF